MNTQCFMLEPTNLVRVSLRRYVSSDQSTPCSGEMPYHNAHFFIGDVTREHAENAEANPPDHDDPSWPRKCTCGFEFAETDAYQVFAYPLYHRSDTGEIIPLRAAPEGAMYYATWLPENFGSVHFKALAADVRARGHLHVKVPGGHTWDVDSKSSNGDGWARTGTPPLVTARPSILTPNYHGWLTNGELIPC